MTFRSPPRRALAAQADLLAVLNTCGDACLGVGAVRQEHGHGRAGVCLGEADAGAGGALFGAAVRRRSRRPCRRSRRW